MVRKYVLAAAVAAGGLAIGASAPASAAETGAAGVAKLNIAQADIMTVGRRGWRGGRGYYRGRGWGYRGYRGYRRGWGGPRFGIYVAPRYYARRCWINRWGYRVCR